MFTPTGFFKPAAATSFDPSLGGTLSVAYHWDWSDSSTMTLSGTDVDDITDKIAGETLTSFSTVAGSGTSDATFSTNKTVFAGNSAYYNTTDWIPDEIAGNQDYSVVLLCTTDYSSFPGSSIIAPWHIAGSRPDGYGYKNMRMTQFSVGYDPYSLSSCRSGTYYAAIMRFNSPWYGVKQMNVQSVAEGAGAMYTFLHDYTNTDLSVTINDNTKCTTNSFFSFPAGTSGYAGMMVGARSEGTVATGGSIDGEWYGDMYHTIIYPSVLSDANISDIYSAWYSFFNG